MKRVLWLTVLMLAVALSMACASGGGGAAGGDETKAPANAKAKVMAEVPSSSPLAKVKVGMSDSEVRNLLGDPSNSNAYVTGKAFIPFYYGGDTARSDWMYKGVGRVVFSRNQWSGALKVINLIHNPSEP